MIIPMKHEDSGSKRELPDIIQAAYNGDAFKVRQLLEEGVDVNSVDPRDDLTVLHIACLQGDHDLVEVILNHDELHRDVDFELRSNFRPRLAWQFAMNSNFTDLAERVHKAGINKNLAVQRKSPIL